MADSLEHLRGNNAAVGQVKQSYLHHGAVRADKQTEASVRTLSPHGWHSAPGKSGGTFASVELDDWHDTFCPATSSQIGPLKQHMSP